MKKSNFTEGIIGVIIGIVCLLTVLLFDTKLEGTLTSFAIYALIFSVRAINKYLYWNKPENKERGREILENEKIEMQDELNVKIKDKSGRYAYTFSINFISVSIIIFHILGEFELIDNARMIILYLGGFLVLQVIVERVVFNHISKKY